MAWVDVTGPTYWQDDGTYPSFDFIWDGTKWVWPHYTSTSILHWINAVSVEACPVRITIGEYVPDGGVFYSHARPVISGVDDSSGTYYDFYPLTTFVVTPTLSGVWDSLEFDMRYADFTIIKIEFDTDTVFGTPVCTPFWTNYVGQYEVEM